ncbi:MAG TPA: lipopolysaccharide assembly protein LapB, partial [Aquabacterium sp.]|nr:lipopolysaccharide assembly protein LapB [Aquabacterium sp.]
EYERSIRIHQHLLARGDLKREERERAQHALAHDFMKAGLFDRAEEAFKALEGTAFATDARLALLSLYERSRNWHPAIEVARQLEAGGTGSFAQRTAHHWCEVAHEADARGRPEEAEQALQHARDVAPQAARPVVMQGQRLVRQGQHAQALRVWDELMVMQPQAFSLIAMDYARCAQACGESAAALNKLQGLYAHVPSVDILNALNSLQPDADARRQALMTHISQQPSLSAAQGLLRERLTTHVPLGEHEIERLQQALTTAAKPLQRYRCAACGFESQHYFWQCPGCQGWDTYPPRRLEDQ